MEVINAVILYSKINTAARCLVLVAVVSRYLIEYVDQAPVFISGRPVDANIFFVVPAGTVRVRARKKQRRFLKMVIGSGLW